MPKRRRQARAAPPAYQGERGLTWFIEVQDGVVEAVVAIVKVAVPALLLVMLMGLVDPKLNVGGSMAPAGLVASTAVMVTLPVKPPAGVSVMVEVLPVVAPGAIETAVPTSEKLDGGGATVTSAVPMAEE